MRGIWKGHAANILFTYFDGGYNSFAMYKFSSEIFYRGRNIFEAVSNLYYKKEKKHRKLKGMKKRGESLKSNLQENKNRLKKNRRKITESKL